MSYTEVGSFSASTIKDLSITTVTGNKQISCNAGEQIKLRLLATLTGPMQDIQVYLGIRGHVRGLKADFNSEGMGYTKKLASANQLIYDGTEKGTGGILHGGIHGFDVLINTNDLKEEGVEYLPPTYRCEDNGITIYVKYLIKVLLIWPGPMQTKLKKDCISELIIFQPASERAHLLCNPIPYVHSQKGSSSLSRETYDREKKIGNYSHQIEWNFSISRQSVIPGDIVKCMMIYRCSILSQITRVRVALIQKTKFRSLKYGDIQHKDGTCILEKFREVDSVDPFDEKMVDFTFIIPKDTIPSMRYESLYNQYFIIAEVSVKGMSKLYRLMETPICVVDPPHPISLERVESVSENMELQHEFDFEEPSATNSLIVFYSFQPTHDDEIYLDLGDLVDIKKSYSDGWSLVSNLSKFTTGIVPTYCLSEAMSAPALPDPIDVSGSIRDIIGDLRRLCKREDRYMLHLQTLNNLKSESSVTMPQLAYQLRPKSRATRILSVGCEECESCLAHQGISYC